MTVLLALFGGTALLLYGIRLGGDSLQRAIGGRLRQLLTVMSRVPAEPWCRWPHRGASVVGDGQSVAAAQRKPVSSRAAAMVAMLGWRPRARRRRWVR